MASTFSTNLAIELIGTGDQAGTWGTTTNSNLGTLIEQAISGYVTQAVATGTDTTITIPNGSTGVARNMYIELTGTGGTNTNLIVPANKKLYFIFNNSTGAVTVKVSGQTGVSVPTGKKMVLVSNGTDIVNGLNYIADFGTNSFSVTNLTASSATITNLIATSGSITNLVSSDASATVLRAGSATLTHLSATSASITNLALTSLTISSLSITNVSVASATVSSNLTLSGGTANGVLYLNGSKVATSGSALVFDGTNLGVGVLNTNALLTVAGDKTQIRVERGSAIGFFYNTGTAATDPLRIQSNAGPVDIYTASGQPITFNAGASEQMRLTSTGLGIGTASPAAKLDVTGFARTTTGAVFQGASNLASGAGLEVGYNTGSSYSFLQSYDRTGSAYRAIRLVGSTIDFDIANSVKATIDSSGNLGIGTASPGQRLHISTATTYQGILINGNQAPSVCFATSTNTTPAWKVGLSGNNSANFAISSGAAATDAVTIDSSGSLGLGVTPSAWSSGKAYETTAAGHALWALSNEINVTQNAYFNAGWKYGATAAAARYQQQSGEHKWNIAASGTAGNTISFTQAMTLDASGSLLIGTTAARAGELVSITKNMTTNWLLETVNTATSGNIFGNLVLFTGQSPNNATSKFMAGSDSTAERFALRSNGGLANYQANDANLSDERVKTDIKPLGSYWDKFKAIEIVSFKYKDQTHEDNNIGVIAQQVESVAPEFVDVDGFGDTPEDGVPLKTIYTTDMYHAAIKALQEAMTRIEQLEAKFAALESK
jgi:hypothetical protein